MLKAELDVKTNLQKYLFDKGFLITNDTISNLELFPFYGNWNKYHYLVANIYVHKRAKVFLYEKADRVFFLIGHAYNPFDGTTDENIILKRISEQYKANEHCEYIDELTGVFIVGCIDENGVTVELDCSGMQYGCYGYLNGYFYIASHMRLVGDIYPLETDDYVRRLVSYKWYHYMMGNYLPGNLTCFKEFKRIIPNTMVAIGETAKVTRFYPNKNIEMCGNDEEYNSVIKEAAKIMQSTMALIPKKWEKPKISLTGGIDSNTTFAAANGNYDKYETFSYVSMPREQVDSDAAKKISEKFKVSFTSYAVPTSNDELPDFEVFKQIFIHNDGEIGNAKDDDTRKKITLIRNNVCDVEVKSWISETLRAYAYKYFGRKTMPKPLSPRNYTSLYKIFLLNRRLALETDKHFAKYIAETELREHLFNYDESDFFVWEMMHGGKCGLNIGVMKSCFDITIPYNNRKLLDLLLRVPLEYRISDKHHLDLKKLMNPELYDMNIRVVNLNETDRRKKLINTYFRINSFIPF